MFNSNNQAPYPLISFPMRVRKAAYEAQKLIQVTDIVAATSCLTAMSASVGPLADWKHPLSGQVRPCVLNQAIVAISGDRKSSADELMCAPIYDRDIATVMSRESQAKAYKVAMRTWSITKRRLTARLKELVRAGKPTLQVEEELEAHDAKEPAEPISHRIVYQDMTRVSAFEALEGDGKAIAVMTDEGQTLLESTVMRHYGFLNNAWEGKKLLTYDRADHQSIIVLNPRVTISFMVQPDVIASFFHKRGRIVQGSGFCARFLFSRSPTLMGLREPKLSNPPVDVLPFQARVRELLELYQKRLQAGPMVRDLLEFDEEAKTQWLRIASDVEVDFRQGHYLADISDFGNKYMDMVGRIACLLHYFELDTYAAKDESWSIRMPHPKISMAMLIEAERIARWHLDEYKAMFSMSLTPLPQELDAMSLYSYLYRTFFMRGISFAEKNAVRRCNGIRGARFDAALAQLQMWFAVSRGEVRHEGAKKNTEVIYLTLPYFQQNPIH